jgi:hypothetical protein
MATLNDTPSFTANEVYEIAATDLVEGAATGASFGGIGVSNEPHQQLANRTAFLKQRQDINIANLATLLGFMANFTGSLQPTGYLEIPIADINRGSVSAIIQWGSITIAQGDFDSDDIQRPDFEGEFGWWRHNHGATKSANFAIPFPNAILIPPIGVLSGNWQWQNWPWSWPWWWPFQVVTKAYTNAGATFGVTTNFFLDEWLEQGQGQFGVTWLAIGF